MYIPIKLIIKFILPSHISGQGSKSYWSRMGGDVYFINKISQVRSEAHERVQEKPTPDIIVVTTGIAWKETHQCFV